MSDTVTRLFQRVEQDRTPTLRENYDDGQSFLLIERIEKDVIREVDYVLDLLNQSADRVDRDVLTDAMAGVLDAIEGLITDDFSTDDDRAEAAELIDTPIGAALYAYQGVSA